MALTDTRFKINETYYLKIVVTQQIMLGKVF